MGYILRMVKKKVTNWLGSILDHLHLHNLATVDIPWLWSHMVYKTK